MDFPKKIKELREQHNYSQVYVASQLGVRHSSYYKYEKGLARPEYENLVKLAKLYSVSTDYLLDLTEV